MCGDDHPYITRSARLRALWDPAVLTMRSQAPGPRAVARRNRSVDRKRGMGAADLAARHGGRLYLGDRHLPAGRIPSAPGERVPPGQPSFALLIVVAKASGTTRRSSLAMGTLRRSLGERGPGRLLIERGGITGEASAPARRMGGQRALSAPQGASTSTAHGRCERVPSAHP